MAAKNQSKQTGGKKPAGTGGRIAGLIAGGVTFGLYTVILHAFGGSLQWGSGLIGAALALGVGALVKIMAPGLDTSTHNRQDREKAPDPLEQIIAQSGDPEADALISRGSETLHRIHRAGEELGEGDITAALTQLEEGCAAIFSAVSEKPERAGQVRKFTEYYLPAILKLLTVYASLKEKGISDQLAEERQRITQTIGTVAEGCRQILTKLYRDEVLDISSEMDVLEKMLRCDGLSESELDAAARQAVEAARIDEAAMRLSRQKAENHVPSVPTMDGGVYYAPGGEACAQTEEATKG